MDDAATMIRVTSYESADRKRWDDVVRVSKNGTFLLERDYLEYHSDRFVDRSLLVWDDESLLALLPLSERNGQCSSHGGLTYGGFVTSARMSVATMLEVFEATRRHLLDAGVASIVYKPVPHIYHRFPAEEDLYALFRYDARLIRVDASTTCSPTERAPMAKGRKWAVGKATRASVVVEPSTSFAEFIDFANVQLQGKYDTSATHTGAELELLAKRFPENIKLWTVRIDGELAAGVVVYETPMVAHAQYISSSDKGREVFAQDAIVDRLLTHEYASKRWFDFGISTEEHGRFLNAPLSANKESWGARTTVYAWYEWRLASSASLGGLSEGQTEPRR